MTFKTYEKEIDNLLIETGGYPDNITLKRDSGETSLNWLYPALGLAGESGEVLDKLKKVVRDRSGELSDSIREGILYELGDALWNLTQLAHALGYTLEEVAYYNIEKNEKRKINGTVSGSGDNR